MTGPGTHLKRMLEWWDIKPREDCHCEEHAAEMDRRGTTWCRANINLIASWLVEESLARGVPVTRSMMYPLIWEAIRRAEGEQSN